LVSSAVQNHPYDLRICLTYHIVLSRSSYLLQHGNWVLHLFSLPKHFPLTLQLVTHRTLEAPPRHYTPQTGVPRQGPTVCHLPPSKLQVIPAQRLLCSFASSAPACRGFYFLNNFIWGFRY